MLVDGDQLPPERELAETFGVSRVTLREAIKALRDAGLVESRRGRGGGTFVVSPKLQSPRRAEQIGSSISERPSTTRSTCAGSSSPARPRWRPPGR